MAQNSANVTSAKPKVVGGFAVAPLGTELPVDASTALDAAFKRVGYITDAGIERSFDISSESENAFGGDVVWTGQSGYGETYSLTLMESKNLDALKLVFGDANVTESGTGATSQINIKTTAAELPEFVAIVDMVAGDNDRRIVIARAKITSRESVNYVSTESIKLGVELTALPDVTGSYSYEYISTPTTP